MKQMLTLLLSAAMIFAAAGTSIAHAQDTVRIATNVPYKPMEYTKPDGTLTGFDIELGNALCKQAGLQCTWVKQSWNGIIPGLMARKYDVIMSSMTINDTRKRRLLFSKPYIVVPSAWFVPADSGIKNPQPGSLKGKKVGVQRGTVQDNYVTDKYPGVTVKRYANADDVAVDMDVGRLDAAFLDFPTGQRLFLENERHHYRIAGDKLSKPAKYFGNGFGIAFRKNEQSLADKFNKALAALKDNGTYQRIYKKYFGTKSQSTQ